MKIGWSYLDRKFPPEVRQEIYRRMDRVAASGDFTLGAEVFEFEKMFAEKVGVKHAIGVGNGTDALKLSLMACGIRPGDEVITAANTFIATAGAICEVGAIPVFVDVDSGLCMDWTKIADAISAKTRAIIPVVWGGNMPDMERIMAIAEEFQLYVIEDAAQGIMCEQNDKRAGSFGNISAFSLHPLKNVSVWGDGGVVVTNDDAKAEWVRLYRNHGLIGRNTVAFAGCNSRLDTLQAVVGIYLLEQVEWLTKKRIENAAFLDSQFKDIPQVTLSKRHADRVSTFTMYECFFEGRNELQEFLKEKGIEALAHYPQPCYWNAAFQHKCRQGDFPITDMHAATKLSLPAHEHLTQDELQYIVEAVKNFYSK
jgi:dTDP-3-amino-2,3,6-trideoxy-4-keto-D-glucose/dTDP-3-amino-3,4,6-trideoxy-alpha-D-glucose/dTDP-2,6-dideoxy-D-kanosamine transaminase